MKQAANIKIKNLEAKKEAPKEEVIEIDVVDLNEPLLTSSLDDGDEFSDGNVDEWHNIEEQLLTEEEVKIIRSNEMLTDILINCAQNILKKQFTSFRFQDTVLGQGLKFKEEKGKFCQILHNGSLH